MSSASSPPPPPESPDRAERASAFAWIAIGLSVAAFGLLYGLEEWSQTRAAWNVIGGGACAIGALVFAILAFRRRSREGSRALPITALVLAIVVGVLAVGGVATRREMASEARACADRDNAWLDQVTPAVVTYRREVLRLSKTKQGEYADESIRAGARALDSLIALSDAAAATDPCDPRITPYNEAILEAGELATTMKLAGEAVLAEPTSQRLVDRWAAARDRVAAAETKVEEEGLKLSAAAVQENRE